MILKVRKPRVVTTEVLTYLVSNESRTILVQVAEGTKPELDEIMKEAVARRPARPAIPVLPPDVKDSTAIPVLPPAAKKPPAAKIEEEIVPEPSGNEDAPFTRYFYTHPPSDEDVSLPEFDFSRECPDQDW